MNFVVLEFDNPCHIKLLQENYDRVFSSCFPDNDELESVDSLLRLLNSNVNSNITKNFYNIIAYNIDDHVVGFSCSNLFTNICSLVIEYICIVPAFQKKGLGKRLYEITLSHGNNLCLSSARKSLSRVYCEVNKPASVHNHQYWYFWKAQNFHIIDFTYVQPALDSNKTTVDYLLLITTALQDDATLLCSDLADFLYYFFKYSFNYADPSAHHATLASLGDMAQDVGLLPMLSLKNSMV